MGGLGAAAQRPLACAAVLFCGGVAAGPLAPPAAWTALSLAALLVVAGAALSRHGPGTSTLLILLAFFGAGAGLAGLRAETSGATGGEAEELVEGTVEGPVQVIDGTMRFGLKVARAHRGGAWTEVRFRVRVSHPAGTQLLPGDRVRARVRTQPPSPPLNPGTPDFAARARAEGLVGSGPVVEGLLVVLGDAPAGQRAVAAFREGYRATVDAAVPDREAAALIRALALGDRADLSLEANEDFSASGLAHILSVSGLHIAVVAAGLYRLLRWLLSRSEAVLVAIDVRAVAALAAIPATWAYVLATGAEVPAVRAAIVASALFLAYGLGRDADGLTSLGTALLAVLAWDPAALRSVSFQLSFAAVAGLAVLARPLRAQIPIARPAPGSTRTKAVLERGREALLQGVAASLAASLATAPIVAAVFHRASLVAVLSNAVALPVASGLTVLAAGSALAAAVSPLAAAPLLALAEPLARALLWLSRAFASLPWASPLVAAPSLAATLAWYAALASIPLLRARRRLALRVAAPALSVLAGLWMNRTLLPLASTELTVTFLSVGQGDAALVQFPRGRTLLIDGGGDPRDRFDVGERVVVPALLDLGADRLDAAALSHPHPDHALGLLSVLRRIPARELWLARGAESTRLGGAAADRVRGDGGAVRLLGGGDRVDAFEPARVEVLHPRDALSPDDNDGSLVLRISLGEVSFLFPGDVERVGEQALALSGDAQADVVKAPHHGSSTSSSDAFVKVVSPGHVVFCVGRNRFGFPHDSVVARYREAGCRVHRTDRDGAVTFRTDGARLDVEHYRP